MSSKTSVLVIDGDADAQVVYASVLEKRPYQITLVSTAEAAIELLERDEVFDLVLLNLALPDLPGIEVLGRIRARYSLTQMPVIVFVEEASNEILESSQELGANEVLLKPFKFSLVLGRIDTQIRVKRAVQALSERESNVRNTLDAIPDFIFRCAFDGRILDISLSGEIDYGLLGTVREGSLVSDVLPESMVNAFRKFRDASAGVGQVDVRRHNVVIKGRDYVLENRLISCANNEFVCVMRDVTAQAKIEDELRALASTDALTRIGNRRHLDETLLSEWRRASRRRTVLSLAIVDVDLFKLYNDSLGHLAGDECLRKVSGVLRDMLKRSGDFAGRFGGEEFAVVMPDTSFAGAHLVAERIREAIVALNIPHPKSPLGVVTVSVGVASLVPDRNSTQQDLVRKADEALYEAKRLGRNKVYPQEN